VVNRTMNPSQETDRQHIAFFIVSSYKTSTYATSTTLGAYRVDTRYRIREAELSGAGTYVRYLTYAFYNRNGTARRVPWVRGPRRPRQTYKIVA
jgi:hypothetical protein